jgi:ABC-type spermidine/putrescine transport system permease subunit II
MDLLEPELKDFLKKIIQSVFIGLAWMTVNMIAGIFLGWMFVGDRLTGGNIIFYLFLVSSLILLVRFYFRIWKKKFPHG